MNLKGFSSSRRRRIVAKVTHKKQRKSNASSKIMGEAPNFKKYFCGKN